MALRVDEVMKRELFVLRPHDRVERARETILSVGITAAPEAPSDVRKRLLDLLGRPPLHETPLRFRAAAVQDQGIRELAVWLALEERP
jgi:hypothetical protein